MFRPLEAWLREILWLLWEAPGSRQLFAPVIEGLPATGADVSRLFPGPFAQFLPALHNVLEHAGSITSSPAIHLR